MYKIRVRTKNNRKQIIMSKKKILVIQGGNSKERDISLKTAKSCIKAIKKIGYKVIKFDQNFLLSWK